MIQNCSIYDEDVNKFNTENIDLDTPCTISDQEAQMEVDSQPQHDPHPSKVPSTVISWQYIERSSADKHFISFTFIPLLITNIFQM